MNTNNQQGRSMVEMLGVLAIIGVLSIGGIAGYTMAMNRYKANEYVDKVAKLSTMVQSIFATGSVPSQSFFKEMIDEVGFKAIDYRCSNNGYYSQEAGCFFEEKHGDYEVTFALYPDGSVYVGPANACGGTCSKDGEWDPELKKSLESMFGVKSHKEGVYDVLQLF